MKYIFFPLFLLCAVTTIAQKKNYFPAWSYHKKNINIHGASLGLWSVRTEPRYTNTNGIKVELLGIGALMPLIPQSPVAQNDSTFELLRAEPLSERINGINLSASGTACDCTTNGIAAGFIGQIQFKVNGISATLFMNFTQIHNGVQISIGNESYKMAGIQAGFSNMGHYARGLQIGLSNKSKNLRGVQIGLWNINQKRKLPLINWNFSS